MNGYWFVNRDVILALKRDASGHYTAGFACASKPSYAFNPALETFALENRSDSVNLEIIPEQAVPQSSAASLPNISPYFLSFKKTSDHRGSMAYVVPMPQGARTGTDARLVFGQDWWKTLTTSFGLPKQLPSFAGFKDDRATGRVVEDAAGIKLDLLARRGPALGVGTQGLALRVPVAVLSLPARRIASDIQCIGSHPAPQAVRYADGGEDAPWGLPLREAFPRAMTAFLGSELLEEAKDSAPEPGKTEKKCVKDHTIADCEQQKQIAPNSYTVCEISDLTLSGLKSLANKAILDTQSDLTPGVIVQGSTIPGNGLRSVGLKRKPMVVHVEGCAEEKTIEDVPVFDFPSAHAAMTRGLGECTLKSQSEAFSAADSTSLDSFKFKLSVSGAYAGFKATVDTDIDVTNERRIYRILYTQVWASARVDLPEGKPISLFADEEQIVEGQISAANYPVLIKEVNYGRQLYVVIETNSAKTETTSNLDLSYQEEEKVCATNASACERNKTSCKEAADALCKPSDPDACGMMKANCINDYDECMDKAEACSTAAALKIVAGLHTLNKNSAENVEAFSSGPSGVSGITVKSSTIDEKKNAIAAWFDAKPLTFSELRPVSVDGLWLEPMYRPATYALVTATNKADCRLETAPPPEARQPVSYTADFESIDDEAFVWEGSAAVGQAKIKANIGTTKNISLAAVGGRIEDGKDATITIKIGNGGGWNSGGVIRLYRNGEKVWTHDEAQLVRHTGWIYRVTLRLTYDGVEVLREDPCVNHLDCH